MSSGDREDRRRYEGDLVYEVWRSGGDLNAVHPDDVDDYYWNDVPATDAAHAEVERQRGTPGHDEMERNE
jgi:hypothetical protein